MVVLLVGTVIFLLLSVLILAGGSLFLLRSRFSTQEQLDQRFNEAKQSLVAQLRQERETRAQLQERAEQYRGQLQALQVQQRVTEQEVAARQREVAHWEGREDRRNREFLDKITELERVRKAFIDERERLLRAEQLQKESEQKNRTRLWKEHEERTISRMKETCISRPLQLAHFDNRKLPAEFDESLKPDFLVQIDERYVIFDVKTSSAQNLSGYLENQVKRTAEKIKASLSGEKIYDTLFFVVPNLALRELKTLSYYEQGYTFHIIAPEAFGPVASQLKRLSEYAVLRDFSPQEREGVVRVVAALEQEILHQSAVNILSTLRGIRAVGEKEILPSDLSEEVETLRGQIRLENFSFVDLKKLIKDPETQIRRLVSVVKNSDVSDVVEKGISSP